MSQLFRSRTAIIAALTAFLIVTTATDSYAQRGRGYRPASGRYRGTYRSNPFNRGYGYRPYRTYRGTGFGYGYGGYGGYGYGMYNPMAGVYGGLTMPGFGYASGFNGYLPFNGMGGLNVGVPFSNFGAIPSPVGTPVQGGSYLPGYGVLGGGGTAVHGGTYLPGYGVLNGNLAGPR